MKRLKFLVFIALLLPASCGREEVAPVEKAICDFVVSSNPDIEEYRLVEYHVGRAVTLDDELSRRVSLFESQVIAHEKSRRDFLSKHMVKNAAKHDVLKKKSQAILDDLIEYRSLYRGSLDSVLYYLVSFTGKGRMKDGTPIKSVEMTAAVNRDCKVFQFVGREGNIYQAMGRAIPAYDYILLKHRSDEFDKKCE